uniref:Uncharacterized protein n=1 Tax=Pan troglodytes TaxID=9598 RepID=A0A2I3SRD5_PANTR
MSLTPSTCWLLEAYPKTPTAPTGSPVPTVPLLPLSQIHGNGLPTDRRTEPGERSRLTDATCQDNSIADPNPPGLRTPPGPSLLEVLHMPLCPVVDDTTTSCLPMGSSFCGSLQDTPHSCPAMQSPGRWRLLNPPQLSRSSSSVRWRALGPRSHW